MIHQTRYSFESFLWEKIFELKVVEEQFTCYQSKRAIWGRKRIAKLFRRVSCAWNAGITLHSRWPRLQDLKDVCILNVTEAILHRYCTSPPYLSPSPGRAETCRACSGGFTTFFAYHHKHLSFAFGCNFIALGNFAVILCKKKLFLH